MYLLCILSKNNSLIFVHGTPDIYLENKDFDTILKHPEIATQIREQLGADKFADGLLIGRLGEEKNGIYTDEPNQVTIELSNKRKELCFYELLK